MSPSARADSRRTSPGVCSFESASTSAGPPDAFEETGGRKPTRERGGERSDRARVAYLSERDGSRAAHGRLLVRLDCGDERFDARAATRQPQRVCGLAAHELVAVF